MKEKLVARCCVGGGGGGDGGGDNLGCCLGCCCRCGVLAPGPRCGGGPWFILAEVFSSFAWSVLTSVTTFG